MESRVGIFKECADLETLWGQMTLDSDGRWANKKWVYNVGRS